MANPNPSAETRFITKRKEPLTSQLSLRLTASMYSNLREREDYREFVRQAIAEKMQRETELQEAG